MTTNNAPKFETVEQEIAYLREQNAKLTQANNSGLGMKVSTKGALSVYGLGRFPITLYKGQWEALIQRVPAIQAFLKANEDKLTVKQAKEQVEEDAA